MENHQVKFTDAQWIQWMDELAANDYMIADDFISDKLFKTIMNFFSEKEELDQLKKAGIGSLGEFQVNTSVRGDYIYWLNRQRDTELAPLFELMDDLTEAFRRFCFLSLSGSEFHIAKYPEGSYYKKHLDQFNETSNRQITVLIYLNKNWKKGNGGELKVYGKEKEVFIEPVAKRLLLFKSGIIEHEVLTTNIPRYSFTGWLLHQPASIGNLFRHRTA